MGALGVYVSSTQDDLKEYRAAARDAILQAGQVPQLAEYAVATEEDALEQALERLRHCSLFVQIVAWDYGLPRGPSAESQIEIEYTEAGRLGLDRLIFLLSEDVKWDPRHVKRTDALIDYRRRLAEQHRCRRFASTGDLTREIVAAVTSAMARQAEGSGIPRTEAATQAAAGWERQRSGLNLKLLPQLVDRRPQDDRLRLLLPAAADGTLTVIVHGHDRDCVEDYFNRVHYYTLRKQLGSVDFATFLMPDPELNDLDYSEVMKLNACEAAGVAPTPPNDGELARALLARPGALPTLMLCTTLFSNELADGPERHLRRFINFWCHQQPNRIGGRVIVFLGIVYRAAASPRGLARWFARRDPEPELTAAIESAARTLEQTHSRCSVLKRLDCIEYSECRRWLQMGEVRELVANCSLIDRKLEAYFNELPGNCARMKDIAPRLETWLAECLR